MVSLKQLLSVVEATQLSPAPPMPQQRTELTHALRQSLPSLNSLLSYPPPKLFDRVQVQSKELRLLDSGPIMFDDQEIVLKLTDDLHRNEIECIRLFVLVNQQAAVLDYGLEEDLLDDIWRYVEDLINGGVRQ